MTPKNPFRWGTQAHRFYQRLTYGPIHNVEIPKELGILQYSKIIGKIRRALYGTGVTIKAQAANHRGTLVEYRLATEETTL